MNIALWIMHVLLATAFTTAGGMKVFAYQKYKAMSEKNGPSGLNHGTVMFIGLSELARAVGIVVPMAVNVAAWLSPAATAGLATVMLLAVFYHVRRQQPTAAPATLFLLALVVAIGRFAQGSYAESVSGCNDSRTT